MGVSWADWKSKKVILLKCCLLLFYATSFPIGLWRAMKSGFYMTISDDHLSTSCTQHPSRWSHGRWSRLATEDERVASTSLRTCSALWLLWDQKRGLSLLADSLVHWLFLEKVSSIPLREDSSPLPTQKRTGKGFKHWWCSQHLAQCLWLEASYEWLNAYPPILYLSYRSQRKWGDR